MNESELYKELGVLTKERNKWEESIPYVSSLLTHESVVACHAKHKKVTSKIQKNLL